MLFSKWAIENLTVKKRWAGKLGNLAVLSPIYDVYNVVTFLDEEYASFKNKPNHINKVSQSVTPKENDEKNDASKEHDWHKCKKFTRTELLTLVLIGNEMIKTGQIKASTFREECKKYPKDFLVAGEFDQLRGPIRDMARKYKLDSTGFENFLREAQEMFESYKAKSNTFEPSQSCG